MLSISVPINTHQYTFCCIHFTQSRVNYNFAAGGYTGHVILSNGNTKMGRISQVAKIFLVLL